MNPEKVYTNDIEKFFAITDDAIETIPAWQWLLADYKQEYKILE